MKNIFIKFRILVVALCGSMAVGCSGFLDADNPSASTVDDYKTVAGQKRLLTSMNARCRNIYNTGELQYFGTDMYMAITASPNEIMFNGYHVSFNSQAGVVGDYWTNLYKIAQEANALLHYCTPESAKNEYAAITAEGRFLRALAYYYLVETFGDVPLFTVMSDEVIKEVERTPESNIYTFMISELENIKGVLPERASAGHISDGAVHFLLGKLYLTRAYKTYADAKDFENAAKAFDNIILKMNGSYKLLDKFADVFAEDKQNNAEVIWAIQYGLDKMYRGGGNPQQALFGYNITALNPEYFGKEQADYSFAQRGYWVIPQVHEWFTDPEMDSRYDVTFKREYYVNIDSDDFGKLGAYFPRWNDESGDDKSAIFFYPFKKDGKYNWYPQSGTLEILNSGSDRMPMVNKFKDTKIGWGEGGSREDIVMRVGDAYLLSAEAHLGNGDEGTALQRLNEVRKRAALTESDKASMELSDIDLDVVLEERGRELLGEHDRWFDLKRTGKLIERAKKYNIFVAEYNNINKNHLVRPIPQDERNKVEGLSQNEGY